nr:glycosyltransferase family 2 protein [Limobrevibacterium gyesilva]
MLELERLDEAEAVLQAAAQRIERHPQLLYLWSRLATLRRDWPEALARWHLYCERFPRETRYSPGMAEGLLAKSRATPGGLAEAAACLAATIRGAPGWELVPRFADYLLHEDVPLPATAGNLPTDADYVEILVQLREMVDWKTCTLRPGATRRQMVSPVAAHLTGKHAWSAVALFTHLALSRIRPTRKAAVVVTMRDEGITILEWVAHYRALGFEGLFVYTNNNSDGSEELLRTLSAQGIVTLIENSVGGGVKPQRKAYDHSVFCLPELRDYEWALYCDSDEFLVISDAFAGRIGNVVDAVGARFPERRPSAICYTWRWYVSNFDVSRTTGLLLERFRHAMPHGLFKSMVRMPDLFSMREVHYPEAAEGGFFVDPAMNVIAESLGDDKKAMWKYANSAYVGGQLNHYWCKSFEEFLIKRRRGDGRQAPASHYDQIGSHEIGLFFKPHNNACATDENFAPPPPDLLARVHAELRMLRSLPGITAAETEVEARYAQRMQALGGTEAVREIWERGRQAAE